MTTWASDLRGFPPLGVLAALAASGYLVFTAWSMANQNYDTWGGLMLLPILAVLTIVLVTREARRAGDTALMRLLYGAMAFKLLGTLARYFVVQVVYSGNTDASQYHGVGGRLAESFRHFDFTYAGKVVGTGFMEILTGMAYALIGVTRLGGFLFFSWVSFLGLYMLFRAFCLACPDGDPQRYGRLLFFFPSLAFWPSSIGKESWMLFTLGITSYGAARLLTHRRGGLPLLLIGLGGTAMVRPHVTLIAFLGIAGAYLVRRPPRPSMLAPVAKGLGIVVLVLIGALVITRVESFFKVDAFATASVSDALERTTERTSEEEDSGSFTATRADNPAGYPIAFVTVMFRPFPWEANNVTAILAAAESVLLFVLMVRSRDRLKTLHRSSSRHPYVGYALLFVLLFTFAFSSVGNFGILARQRVQVFPFLFVLMAAPIVVRERKPSRAEVMASPPVYWALPSGTGRPSPPA